MGTITLNADPIIGFKTAMSEIIISGWDVVDEAELLERINRFPCAYCYVTETRPLSIFEQENADMIQFLAGIKVIDQGTSRSILEKKIYRYTHAIYSMMRSDTFLSDSGWAVTDLVKVYSGTVPSQPLLKAGAVNFMVKKASVA